jgi:hypothetical protein
MFAVVCLLWQMIDLASALVMAGCVRFRLRLFRTCIMSRTLIGNLNRIHRSSEAGSGKVDEFRYK